MSSALRSHERNPAKRASIDSSQRSQRGVSRIVARAASTSATPEPVANITSRAHAVPGVRGSASPAVTANASRTIAEALARRAWRSTSARRTRECTLRSCAWRGVAGGRGGHWRTLEVGRPRQCVSAYWTMFIAMRKAASRLSGGS